MLRVRAVSRAIQKTAELLFYCSAEPAANRKQKSGGPGLPWSACRGSNPVKRDKTSFESWFSWLLRLFCWSLCLSHIFSGMQNYTAALLCVLVALFSTVYSQPPVSYLQLEMNNNSVSLLVLAVLVVAAVHYFGGIGTGTGRPPHSAKTSWPELVGKKGEKAKAIR